MGHGEEMGRVEERLNLQDVSSVITTSILEEMRGAEPLDAVTLVCKDGETMNISSLFLASVSPYLAEALKYIDIQDSIIFLPDIEVNSVKYIFENALSKCPSSVEADKEIIEQFDGVFWNNRNLFLSKVKKDDVDFEDDLDVKDEMIEDNENYQYMEDDVDPEKYSNGEFDSKDSINLKSLDKDIEYLVKTKNNSESKKVKKKRKLLQSDDSDLEEKKIARKRGRPSLKSKKDAKKIINSQPKKVVDPSQITDESFLTAQENLRKDLEDVNNLEDPKYLWYQYHGLNSQLYLLKTHDKILQMICPVCWLKFPRDKSGGKHYFAHLRTHKYKHFQCRCFDDNNKGTDSDHIQQNHWKWERCEQCKVLFEPDLLRFHLINRHPEYAKDLQCHLCSYSSKKIRFFKQHMDNHLRGPASCGCVITFSSKRHKEFHLQAVHLKEKVVCDKTACFYLCDTEEQLKEHRLTKHIKKEAETTPQRFVCDLCGQVYRCVSTLKTHEKSVHDTVLHECPHCSIKLNKYSLQRHLKRAHNGLSVCNVCGAKVKQLKNHMAMHIQPDQMKFKCSYCPKGFMLKYKLERHVMSVHLKDRSYPCRYGCDSAYNSSSSRNEHEKRQHGQLYSENKIKV